MTAPTLHTVIDYEAFVRMLDACAAGILVSVETWRDEFDAAQVSGSKRGGMFRQAANEGRLMLAPFPTHARPSASKGGTRLQYIVTGAVL